MKALVWLLALANLLALAWWQGWLDRWLPSAREPERVAAQIAPDRIRVVPLREFDAALALARGRCLEVGPVDDLTLQRLLSWGTALPGAQTELERPLFRVRFPLSLSDEDLAARRAELAGLAGRDPAPCAVK
jgi:hypothetical protein